MNQYNKIFDVCEHAILSPYVLGVNDCNVIALKVLDIVACTEYTKLCTYDTLRKGKNILKKLGVSSTLEIIKLYADEVQYPIPGDIWVDADDEFCLSVYISGRILVVDKEHSRFELELPMNGKYYRIRSK